MKRKYISLFLVIILIPALAAAGAVLFAGKNYGIVSMLIALLACAAFFLKYERRRVSSLEMIIIAVMAALSAASRVAFAAIPHIKPVTAITIITAMHFGPEAGFVTGAMSALVSNMFFGQGPWTPFQMFAWGLTGFLAGLLSRARWFKNYIVLSVFAALTGILFSLVMDVWTVLSIDRAFNTARYITFVIASGPIMLEYAISNILFLLLLKKPLGDILLRIKTKYRP